MPGTRELRVGALLLRRHIAQDAEVLYQSFGVDEAMHSHTGWNPYPTREEAEKFVARLIASYDDPRFYSWAIRPPGAGVFRPTADVIFGYP